MVLLKLQLFGLDSIYYNNYSLSNYVNKNRIYYSLSNYVNKNIIGHISLLYNPLQQIWPIVLLLYIIIISFIIILHYMQSTCNI